MNAKLLTLAACSATFLMGIPGVSRAQEATVRSTVAATDASDRQFLRNLEGTDAQKSSPAAAKPAEPSVTSKFDTYSAQEPTASSASNKEPANSNAIPKATETHKAPQTNETASVTTQKAHEKVRRITHREDPSRPVEVASDSVTVIVNGERELPEAGGDGRVAVEGNERVEDHRFFHRLFGHIFRHDRDGQ
jgi:hypothetical protein